MSQLHEPHNVSRPRGRTALRPRVSKVTEFLAASYSLGDGLGGQWRLLWDQTKNLRVGLGIAHHHPREIHRLSTRFGPIWVRDNFGDITNVGNLLHRAVYRWRSLPDEGIVLDVGANIGLAAVWFAHFNPTREIWCLEPLPENVAMIRRNCPHATTLEIAVGEREGSVELLVDPDAVIASTIPTAWESVAHSFRVRSLDDCAAEYGWGPVALLKIDAEGMEAEILRGARQLLSRVARVACETHGEHRHALVLDGLRAHGFAIESETFSGATGMVFAVQQPGTARA